MSLPVVTVYTNDHDLLISVATKLDVLITTLETLKADIVGKADLTTVTDHEARIRTIESWLYKGLGAITVLNIILSTLVTILLKKLGF